MKVSLQVVLAALCTSLAAPAGAQTADELRQQLEAQKAINEQLRKRVEELERRVAGAPPAPSLQPLERRPSGTEPEMATSTTAIEEALVAKGLVLLRPGTFRLAPGFTWVHDGADALRTRSDTYSASVTADVGLPLDMMFSANLPYVRRSTSIGSNSGAGDFSLALSKQLVDESNGTPSLVASLSYLHNSGKDPFRAVPIGFGFRTLAGTLAALKRIDPVAVYGSLSYVHPYPRNVSEDNLLGEARFTGRIAPGSAWGYRFGASLAATPDITFDASLSGAFARGTEVRSNALGNYTQPKSTTALINLGAGFLLTRHLSLLLSASAGATKDSPDFIFSVTLPYRF
jgi:hypothetical protein